MTYANGLLMTRNRKAVSTPNKFVQVFFFMSVFNVARLQSIPSKSVLRADPCVTESPSQRVEQEQIITNA